MTALGDEVNEAARIEACATGGRTIASKVLIERLDPVDAEILGIDSDRATYTLLADLATATDKARRGTRHPSRSDDIARASRSEPSVNASLRTKIIVAGRLGSGPVWSATQNSPQARLASRVIAVPVSALLTGQFSLASSAARTKSSADTPGTEPRTVR